MLNMGNKQGSLANHLETASKTGALAFPAKRLEEFPEPLQKVSGNLRNLDLSDNRITSVPRWISHFRALKTLNLKMNRITSLPEEIGQLVKLEILIGQILLAIIILLSHFNWPQPQIGKTYHG